MGIYQTRLLSILKFRFALNLRRFAFAHVSTAVMSGEIVDDSKLNQREKNVDSTNIEPNIDSFCVGDWWQRVTNARALCIDRKKCSNA